MKRNIDANQLIHWSKKWIKFSPLLLGFFIILNCESDNTPEPLNIYGTWYLSQISNKSSNEIQVNPNNNYPQMNLLESDSINCHGGCNSGEGSFLIQGNKISIDCPLTKVACPQQEVMQWESIFLNNLNAASGYELKLNKLIIITDGNYDLTFDMSE